MFLSFLLLFQSPLAGNIIQLNKKNHDSEIAPGNIFVKYYSPGCSQCISTAPIFQELADTFENYADKVRFAEIDCVAEPNTCDNAHIVGYPTFYYYRNNASDITEYADDYLIDGFAEFVAKLAGIPFKRRYATVKTLTRDSFDRVVMDPTKHVMLSFTAPWCPHSREFMPEFQRTAASFVPEDGIVFANIDGDKHADLSDKYEVSGFPNIRFFPAYRPGDNERILQEAEAKSTRTKERKAKLRDFLTAREKQHTTETETARKLWETAKSKADGKTGEPFPEFVPPELPLYTEEEQKLIDEEIYSRVVVPRKGIQGIDFVENAKDATSLVSWLNRRLGLFRAVGGGVNPDAGLIIDLQPFILNFTHAVTHTSLPDYTAEGIGSISPPSVDDARTALFSAIDDHTNTPLIRDTLHRYAKALEEKGIDWVKSEASRLSKLLTEGLFDANQLVELTVRKNIASSFYTI